MKELLNISFENTEIAFASKSDRALKKMYRLFALMNIPWLIKAGNAIMKLALRWGFPVKNIIKRTLFSHFCGGEAIEGCELTIRQLAEYDIGTILDYSVESGSSEKDFEFTKQEIIKTIKRSQNESLIPFCVFKITGLVDKELLEKAQVKLLKPDSTEQKQLEKAINRVDEICYQAYTHRVRIFIDAEESWIQNILDEWATAMMRKYNKEMAIVYNTYQLYRKDMLGNLKKAFHDAVANQYYLGAKLVRGAYMEKERKRAYRMEYESPIQVSKEATDGDFNKALKFCINNLQRIWFCSGTHNEYSNYFLTLLIEKYNVKRNDNRIYFAQLYGMSDHISYNLAYEGFNVAKYVPYGPVKEVMPYLVRRAEENTAIAGQSSREYRLIKKEINRRKI